MNSLSIFLTATSLFIVKSLCSQQVLDARQSLNSKERSVVAGYGVGSGFETVKELCSNSKVQKGFQMKAGVERDGILLDIKDERATAAGIEVKRWLENIGMVEEKE
jgi:hypothetical protein